MKIKLGILVCLISLGIGLICPAICAATTTAAQEDTSCCNTTTHQTTSPDCKSLCSLRSEPIAAVAVHSPQLEIVQLPCLTHSDSAILFSPPKEACTPPLISYNLNPPQHLAFLKTIRLQC